MIEAVCRYQCYDCGIDHEILLCKNGAYEYDLCLDCFLKREKAQKEGDNSDDDYEDSGDLFEMEEQRLAINKGQL